MNRLGFTSRIALFGSAAASALTLGSAANAQAQEQQTAPQEGQASPQEQQSAADQANPDIVVTAQKREERLQDVPVSISVVSGEDMAEKGATQLTEIAGYVPGLHVNNLGAPGQTQVSLRGIFPMGAGAAVGTYVDDAPVGSSTVYTESAAFIVDLLPYDIARIEVLRGPQGTLYGASTVGGLLKYVTVVPDLNDFHARAGVEGFSLAHAGKLGFAVQGLVNVPLINDQLAITASFAHRKTPGWIDNVQTGAHDQNSYDQTGFRGSLLWRPTDNLSIRLSAMHQEIDSNNATIIAQDLTGTRLGNGRSNWNYIPETLKSDFTNYAGTIEYDFGFATLSSATSWTDAKRVEVQDGSRLYGPVFPLFSGGLVDPGLAPFTNAISMKKLTEEVRLTSRSGGRFEWMAGFFYTDEDAGNDQVVRSLDFNGQPTSLDPFAIAALPSTYKEYAFFGNATFRVTDQFWLSGGLRWSHNDQTFRQQSAAGPILPEADTPNKSDESIVTYSISPQYHVNDDTMIYGRIATGYRPGGPNVIATGIPPTFDPDTVTNYELGLKTRLFNRTVAVDLALFRIDWDDIQVTQDFPGGSALGNGDTARSQGFEAAVLWQPLPGLSLGANGAYTDAELTADAPGISGQDGDRLPLVPKFSGALTADYEFPVSSSVEAAVGAGVRYTGSRRSAVGSDPTSLHVGAYTAIDLNGSVTFGDRYTVRAYVRNLTDSGGPISRTVFPGFFGPINIIEVPLQPRTIGLAAEVSF